MRTGVSGLSKRVVCVLVFVCVGLFSAYCGPIEDFEDGSDPGDDFILWVSSTTDTSVSQLNLFDATDEMCSEGILVEE